MQAEGSCLTLTLLEGVGICRSRLSGETCPCRRAQGLKRTTVPNANPARAGAAGGLELLAQGCQLNNALFHQPNMRIKEGVDLVTRLVGVIL